jgi:putative transcriptional regulator
MLKNNLKSWRHKHEMNQTEFAAFLGVSVSLYNNWERQHRQPSLEWALKIAQKLNCHVDDILEIDSTP